jgi:hypothetical protein
MPVRREPAPRPDEAPSQRRAERRWLPVLGVVAVILLVSGGARTVADATAGPPQPPTGVPGTVIVQPRPGWSVDPGARVDDGSLHEVLLVRGTADLLLVGIDGYGGSASDLARDYVERVLGARFAQLSVGRVAGPVALHNGVPAVQFGYVGVTEGGVSVEGAVTIAIAGGSRDGVVFDGYAPEGDLAWAAGDIRAMVAGAEVG